MTTLITVQEFIDKHSVSDLERQTLLRVYGGKKKSSSEWIELLSGQYDFLSVKPAIKIVKQVNKSKDKS